jgi:hypothetical protein
MFGAVVSTTVTAKLQVTLLRLASLAVQITVVGPGGNRVPEAGMQLTSGLASQLSVAVALKLAGAPDALTHSTV